MTNHEATSLATCPSEPSTAAKIVVYYKVHLRGYCTDIPSTVDWQLSDGIVASLSENISTGHRQIAGGRKH